MFKVIIIGFIGLVTFFTSNFYKTFDLAEKEQKIIYAVKTMVDYVHFSTKKVNDNFSQEFFEEYLNNLDGLKRFLTQDDVNQLEVYKNELDNQILEENLEFFDLSYTLVNGGVEKTKGFYKELLQEPFEFNSEDTLELDPEKRKWAQNDEELKEQWRGFFKYEVLTRVLNKLEDQEKDKDESKEEAKSFEEIEKESRERVEKIYGDMYKRMDKIEREDRFEVYVNAFSNLFDPHTQYYSPKDKEDFDIRMGGKLEGIGARLQTDGDYTKIASIIAGGPAWKGKELEPNDLILKVAQEDSEDFMDLVGMRLDKVVTYIRGKKDTKVRLEIKKADGTIKIIEIIRDEVIIEEGKAKSVVVGYKGSVENNVIDNIGFIRLPSFYSDFKSREGENCAKDIKTELGKLKDKNVKGVILDLRFNGGGSLKDVITMAGYFIEKGPIVQVKPGKEKPYVHKDNDSSVEYDGPLVILVNEMSASASEILAAAMQDYKRAVIVGSKETFGKGTVQRFFDLDNMIRGANDVKPLGNLKVTTQKFYRINGGSTQLKGVGSDVVLPDRYMHLEVGEREYDNALPWDKIEALEYNQNAFVLENTDKIVKRSQSRMQNDSSFIYIEQNAQKIKEYSESTLISMNIEDYKNWKENREKEDKFFKDKLNNEIPSLVVENLEVDMPHIQIDSSRIERNEAWLNTIKKDQYIKEAIFVVNDIIELENK